MDVVDYYVRTVIEFYNGLNNLELLGLLSSSVIGTFTFYKVFWTPFRLYMLARIFPGVNLKKLGTWAVITGSTDGLGKAYATSLASKGLDIVLISRSADKLHQVKEEITLQYKCQVKTIQVDFTSTDIYDKLSEEMKGLDVAILVNNVGMSEGRHGPFLETSSSSKLTTDLLNTNCSSMTNMCSIVLPGMLEKQKGVIVNITSMLGFMGTTNSSLYAASKSYCIMLSRCLQRSYGGTGVLIQTLTPGMIRTKMMSSFMPGGDNPSFTARLAGRLLSLPADVFVESAIRTIGWSDYCNGHPLFYFMTLLLAIQPEWLVDLTLNSL